MLPFRKAKAFAFSPQGLFLLQYGKQEEGMEVQPLRESTVRASPLKRAAEMKRMPALHAAGVLRYTAMQRTEDNRHHCSTATHGEGLSSVRSGS